MNAQLVTFVTFIAACLGPSVDLYADPPKGMFPPELEVGSRKAVLNGAGLCEYGMFNVDVYWGALYLEKKSKKPREVIRSDQLKRIHLHFVRALTSKQMRAAYEAAFKITAGPRRPRFATKIAEFQALLTEVKKGESLLMTYTPEKGLEISIAGKVRGTVEGAEFARLVFELYFGETPPDPNLKRGMLGK